MRLLKFIFIIAFIFGVSCSAKAFVMSDVYEINRNLATYDNVHLDFNLANQGYNHLTDTITNIKITYNLREIIDTEEFPEEGPANDDWEFVIFYSWIFNGRNYIADVDTGLLTFETPWGKSYECQHYYYVDGEGICDENLDLFGNLPVSLVIYTNNLWLGEARLDAEITRISVPEPAPLLMLGLGLVGLAARFKRSKNKLVFLRWPFSQLYDR